MPASFGSRKQVTVDGSTVLAVETLGGVPKGMRKTFFGQMEKPEDFAVHNHFGIILARGSSRHEIAIAFRYFAQKISIRYRALWVNRSIHLISYS